MINRKCKVLPMINRKCKACGRDFYLKDSEIEFYHSKSLELPHRCFYCRKQKKDLAQTAYDLKVKSRAMSINDSKSVAFLKRALG